MTCDAFSSLLQNPQQLHGQFLVVTKCCLQLPAFEFIGSMAQFCCLVSWVSSSYLTVWYCSLFWGPVHEIFVVLHGLLPTFWFLTCQMTSLAALLADIASGSKCVTYLV